jgi:hypothetical protein
LVGDAVMNANVTMGALMVTGASYMTGNVTMASSLVVDGPALQIPHGNIAARPATPQDGYIRYNSETQQFEGYGPGSAWGSLGGVIDIAQTTKVLASASPSTTDGNLYFFTVGDERMRVNSAGNIGIGTTAPTYLLDVNGTLQASIGLTAGSLFVTGESHLESNVTAGAMAVTGELIVSEVNMTPSAGDIFLEQTFNGANSVPAFTSITGFAFDNDVVRSFEAQVSVGIDADESQYAVYRLMGIQKNGQWTLNASYTGDQITDIAFGINSSGQLQYTSLNISGWSATTIKFRAFTTSV